MTRVVIGTDVFIATFFDSSARKIVDLWKTGRLTICLSRQIVEEYIQVMELLGIKDEALYSELYGLFSRRLNLLYTMKAAQLDMTKDDPDRDMFIECAAGMNAAYIISNDKSLLSLCDHMGISIKTPDEFLEAHP